MSPPRRSPLRTASNIVVAVLLIGIIGLGLDALLYLLGFTPYLSCEVMPVWSELAQPWAGIVTVIGLGIWLVSRFTSGMGFLIMVWGVLLELVPWGWAYVLNPICT